LCRSEYACTSGVLADPPTPSSSTIACPSRSYHRTTLVVRCAMPQMRDAVGLSALLGAGVGFRLRVPAIGQAYRDDHADLQAVSVVATDELVKLAQLLWQVESAQVDARRGGASGASWRRATTASRRRAVLPPDEICHASCCGARVWVVRAVHPHIARRVGATGQRQEVGATAQRQEACVYRSPYTPWTRLE
jgi:hypothetical protein